METSRSAQATALQEQEKYGQYKSTFVHNYYCCLVCRFQNDTESDQESTSTSEECE